MILDIFYLIILSLLDCLFMVGFFQLRHKKLIFTKYIQDFVIFIGINAVMIYIIHELITKYKLF